jgi:hypothetical protein
MLSVTQINIVDERMISKWWIWRYVEGSGRGLILGEIPEFAWRVWEKAGGSLIRIADLQAETWTRDLPNMRQEY